MCLGKSQIGRYIHIDFSQPVGRLFRSIIGHSFHLLPFLDMCTYKRQFFQGDNEILRK